MRHLFMSHLVSDDFLCTLEYVEPPDTTDDLFYLDFQFALKPSMTATGFDVEPYI